MLIDKFERRIAQVEPIIAETEERPEERKNVEAQQALGTRIDELRKNIQPRVIVAEPIKVKAGKNFK